MAIYGGSAPFALTANKKEMHLFWVLETFYILIWGWVVTGCVHMSKFIELYPYDLRFVVCKLYLNRKV